MLVLTRKVDQPIRINDNIEIRVLEIRGNRVRLGIVAPSEVTIVRKEALETRNSRTHVEVEPTCQLNEDDPSIEPNPLPGTDFSMEYCFEAELMHS